LTQFKKYLPSESLISNNLGIFQGLTFCILMAKILSISLKLNFPLTFHGKLHPIAKCQPSGNLKLNNLDISRSLKLRNRMGKTLRIPLKLNFTPNILG